MKSIKILIFGVVNYFVRFAVGGFIILGLKVNPEAFWFGLIVTLVALVTAFVFLKYVMKPATTKSAVMIALVWIIIALVLDIITAQPVVKVTVGYLLHEVQTWTRLLVILLVAPLTVRN